MKIELIKSDKEAAALKTSGNIGIEKSRGLTASLKDALSETNRLIVAAEG